MTSYWLSGRPVLGVSGDSLGDGPYAYGRCEVYVFAVEIGEVGRQVWQYVVRSFRWDLNMVCS